MSAAVYGIDANLIDVEVDLSGTVKSKLESDHATELATRIKAVKAVHNNLKVDGT